MLRLYQAPAARAAHDRGWESQRWLHGMVAALATWLAWGCTRDGSGTTEPEPPPPSVIHAIGIVGDSTVVMTGMTLQYHAVATDSIDRPIPGLTFEWASSDSAVATVDASGLVRGVGIGLATITTSAGGKTGSAPVVVLDATVLRSPIAFTSERDENAEIYLINADGTGLRNLTRHPAADRDPAWSNDHRKLVFVSNRDGNDELYVMEADGTGLHRLTHTPENESWPDWSPDGSRIAFVAPVPGVDSLVSSSCSYNGGQQPVTGIWTIAADGSDRRLIVRPAPPPPGFSQSYSSTFSRPAWSPDGRSIAYQAKHYYECTGIETLDLRTGSRRVLIPGGFPGGSRRADYEAPQWSPDGRRIAFQGYSSTGRPRGVYVANSDGTEARRLGFPGRSVAWHPTWSPNGRFLAFSTNRDSNWEIYRMRENGAEVRRVTDHPMIDGSPAWR